MHTCTVVAQGFFEGVFNVFLIFRRFHVDEVNHHQTAQVAQTQLTGNFFGCFKIGFVCRVFDVRATGCACAVDIHRDQGFGVVNHNRATRWQWHGARIGGFDLVLNLKTRVQRNVIDIAFDAVRIVRHDHTHERLRLLENFLRINQNFADVGLEVVANRANYQRRFKVNQKRRGVGAHALCIGIRLRRAINCLPQLHQVIHVPLQLFGRTTNPCCARNQTHARRDVELTHRFTQLLAILAFDATRHTTTTWIVRHQHKVTTCQRNKGGQCRTFVAAFFFFDLNDDFLTLNNRILNARRTRIHT